MKHAAFKDPATFDLIMEMGKKQADKYVNHPIIVSGNSKVGFVGREGIMLVTRGISYWSCPGKTTGPGGCDNGCYAHYIAHLNLERGYDIGAAYTYMAYHDIPRLQALLSRDLSAYSRFPKVFVRIHDAGDFVSAEHVKMYQALATEYPLIQFWGMSHSWSIPAIGVELLRFNKLQNVVIRESTDPASPVWSGLAPQFHYDAKVPFVAWMKQEAAAENPAILCPAQFKIKIGPKSVRVTTCLQCQKCWTQADRPVGSYEH